MGLQKCLDFNNYNKYPDDSNPTTNAQMQEFLGNQNSLLSAVSNFLWQPNTAYVAGQIVFSNSIGAGLVGVVTTAGTTGSTEPTWTGAGTGVSSGSVVFTIYSMPIGVNVSGTGNGIKSVNMSNGVLTFDKSGNFVSGFSKGSATQPVYVNSSGVATACTYTLGKSVPSNAVFTDTKTTVTTSGTGNAVTGITASNGALTVTKGSSYISGFSKGNATTPIYSNSSGVATACTMASSSAVGIARIAEQNLTANSGYVKFNNGFTINWGKKSSTTFTFQKEFTTIFGAWAICTASNWTRIIEISNTSVTSSTENGYVLAIGIS